MTTPTPENAPREGERIAKLLARAGIASRREVERIDALERRLAEHAVERPAAPLGRQYHVAPEAV